MSYISLYRKWRSQDFDQIVGQPHIVQTLKNAIEMDRLSHAYLFTGPRGTGKTSTARVLAKALNCEKGPTIKPCDKCTACQKIKDGHAPDVIEIDAASNRGIDEIRDLRERVRYAPMEGRYKIYIIDEVHMLTSEAFNALLKTLEEPPSQVVFVLATTEPQRVPATIASRCQRLDFRRIASKLISEHLCQIAETEKIKIDEKAVSIIVRNADGSMRDAISLLDQVASFAGSQISADKVLLMLGSSDEQIVSNLVQSLIARDIAAVINNFSSAVSLGATSLQIMRDLISYFRQVLFIKLGSIDLVDVSEVQMKELGKQADSFSLDEIKQIISIISKAELDMKWHPHPRLVAEVCLINMLIFLQPADKQEQAISKEELEKERSVSPLHPSSQRLSNADGEASRPAAKVVLEAVGSASGKPEDLDLIAQIKANWMKILELVREKSLSGYVSMHEGQPLKINSQGFLIIAFRKGFSFHKEQLESQKLKMLIETVLETILNKKIPIKAQVIDKEDFSAKAVKTKTAITPENVKDMFNGRMVN